VAMHKNYSTTIRGKRESGTNMEYTYASLSDRRCSNNLVEDTVIVIQMSNLHGLENESLKVLGPQIKKHLLARPEGHDIFSLVYKIQ
jgi:hypothetical protein